MEFAIRKSPRIKGYDYSKQNYYFVTICAYNHKCLFGNPEFPNHFGKIAEKCLQKIPEIYKTVQIDKYVIMPNHVHAIVVLEGENSEENLIHVIGQYKMAVTKEIHAEKPRLKVWQRSFHDHVIRNQESYQKIWQYIDDNPRKWEEDCFYKEIKKDQDFTGGKQPVRSRMEPFL